MATPGKTHRERSSVIFVEVRYHMEVPATPSNTAVLLDIGTSVSADRFRLLTLSPNLLPAQ